MDMKKFNEEIDKFDLNSIDIADIEMSEVEFKRIKNKAKKQCRVSKTKKVGVAAAIAGIVVVGGIVTPVVAENVPFVKDIFYELGLFDKDIEEYIETVGQTKTTEYGETTLDNLVVTDNRILVGMTYKSKEPIPLVDEYENRFFIELPDTEGIYGGNPLYERKKIDDHTIAISVSYDLIGGGILKSDEMFIELKLEGEPIPKNYPANTVWDAGPPKELGKFEVGTELKRALDEHEIFKVDVIKGEKDTEEYEKFISLESNILGTTLYSKKDKNSAGKRWNYDLILVVDGKEHKSTDMAGFDPLENELGVRFFGRKAKYDMNNQYRFDTVKINDTRNAKSIELLVDGQSHKVK
ncbi:MAG: DUF4179 domain-containing protein [Sarcina sp.]